MRSGVDEEMVVITLKDFAQVENSSCISGNFVRAFTSDAILPPETTTFAKVESSQFNYWDQITSHLQAYSYFVTGT